MAANIFLAFMPCLFFIFKQLLQKISTTKTARRTSSLECSPGCFLLIFCTDLRENHLMIFIWQQLIHIRLSCCCLYASPYLIWLQTICGAIYRNAIYLAQQPYFFVLQALLPALHFRHYTLK